MAEEAVLESAPRRATVLDLSTGGTGTGRRGRVATLPTLEPDANSPASDELTRRGTLLEGTSSCWAADAPRPRNVPLGAKLPAWLVLSLISHQVRRG